MPGYIRLLTTDDAEVLASIAADNAYPWNKATFYTSLELPYRGFGFIQGHQMVGFVIVRLLDQECELVNLAVLTGERGKGVAQTLLNHAIDFLHAKRMGSLFLEVRRSNTSAIRFYKKMGAVEIGVRKNYYPNVHGREDGAIFKLELMGSQ